MHYKRLTRTGKLGGMEAQVKLPNLGPCAVEVCERPAITKTYCEAHYQRFRKYGTPGVAAIGAKVSPGVGGRWLNNHGYMMLTLPREGGRRVSEHRYVMERHLGRPLRTDESVHHRNGVKTDNRLENLELWARIHPTGQRVEDLVAWAQEILARYAV